MQNSVYNNCVMKVGIFYKEKKVPDQTVVTELSEEISRRKNEAVIFRSPEEIAGVDRLIVLGGDGTILNAAHASSEQKIPLVGVNFGTRGFLTEFEREDYMQAVSLALDPACPVVRRSMLELDFNGVKTHCLNEMLLHRRVSGKPNAQIATFCVDIDGSDAGELRADGLIVCTPTGSTAYSLSAGGNILAPDCAAFLITPVCAFSLRSRPIAYSDSCTLSFRFTDRDCTLELYGDGKFIGEASANDTLTVRKSPRCTAFLTRDKNGFFRKITEKIG